METQTRRGMTVGKYTLSFVALLLLTALTLALSFAHLGAGEWLVALGIAVVKSIIVAWFFMHLFEMSVVHRMAGVVAASLLAVLIVLAMADIWTRPKAINPETPAWVSVPNRPH